MKNVKNMRYVLDFFIQSLPKFVENARVSGSFIILDKSMIIYRGNITPTLMKEWCKIAEEKTIPFKSGTKGIVELTWGIIELTPDVTINVRLDGEKR